MSRILTAILAAAPIALLVAAPSIAAAADVRGRVYDSAPPMDVTVQGRIRPQLEALATQLLAQRRDLTLDGVKVFEADDKFLPGKIAVGLSALILSTPRDDPKFAGYLAGFRQIADLTVDDTNDTWGIYYYCEALYGLQRAGLLDQAVSPATLARLKLQLDWRRFVRPGDLTLIDLPNNYYGVAFSVARLRMLLGWEDASASEALLARAIDHYRKYSGAYGFADETDGGGRFDRYSVLLIGELSQRFIETGMTPPPEVKAWLRRSVDLLAPRMNLRGEGFEYGRSIGAYGETCFLEVFTAAAKLGVLTPREEAMAYAFSARIAARYADFWLDPKMGSVNLWEHGRRTDAYRAKHRILGENLSLTRQLLYTNALWNDLGFKGRAPDPGFAAWLGALPRATTTWFARGEYDRLVVTVRDGDHVIGLPLINGGAGQHMNAPYFPTPFSPGMLSGVADSGAPNLTPRFTLADGARLMPLAWYEHVKVTTRGRTTTVTYDLPAMDRMGADAPVIDRRLTARTTYILAPGRITRIDEYRSAAPLAVQHITLDFGTYSAGSTVSGGRVSFRDGDVRSLEVSGLGACKAQPLADDPAWRTPVGALSTRVACETGPITLAQPLKITWTLRYR